MLNWIILLFAFEIGLTEEIAIVTYHDELEYYYQHPYMLYFDLQPEFQLFGFVNIKNNIFILTQKSETTMFFFAPRVDYTLDISIKYKNIELGFKHKCRHMSKDLFGDQIYYGNYEGGNSKIYLRYRSN